MYLGSRPAVSVARWLIRPEMLVPSYGSLDHTAGWPIHQGQSNKRKHHHCTATVSSPLLEPPAPFLVNSRSLTEYQQWPISEFELVEEGEEEGASFGITRSEVPLEPRSDFLLLKQESFGEETILRTRSDGMSFVGDENETGVDSFPESELVFNRHAHEMKLSLPERSTKSGRSIRRQTGGSVCRSPTCRRRVHPVGKFADELVSWIPENGETEDDEEKDEDDDTNDLEFKHCTRTESNGSRVAHVNVKQRTKRQGSLSRYHSKRKRTQFSEKTAGGLHRRRKQHNPWKIEETRMLIKGVSICGEGHWADIKRLDFPELLNRSPVDLKDKWRNLLRLAQITDLNIRHRKGDKRTDLPRELLNQVKSLASIQK